MIGRARTFGCRLVFIYSDFAARKKHALLWREEVIIFSFYFFAKISRYIMETNKVDKLYILKGECVMLKDTMKDYVNDMREAEKELINYAFEEDMFEHMDDRENLIMAKLIKLLHRSRPLFLLFFRKGR